MPIYLRLAPWFSIPVGAINLLSSAPMSACIGQIQKSGVWEDLLNYSKVQERGSCTVISPSDFELRIASDLGSGLGVIGLFRSLRSIVCSTSGRRASAN